MGRESVGVPLALISNEDYLALYKRRFKHHSLGIERTIMWHLKDRTWANIEKRMHSNETAVRLGVHRASVWTRAQLLTWSKLESRKKSANRWSIKAHVKMRPEELALVRPGWEFADEGVA